MPYGGAARPWFCPPAPFADGAGFVPRLAVFDLDGTLLPDPVKRTFSPRTHAAIRAAQAQGVMVTLASGRTFRSLLPFAQALGIEAPLLCYQGAWIQLPNAPEPLVRQPLAPELARLALELADEHDWLATLYTGELHYVKKLPFAESLYRDLMGELIQVSDWGTVLMSQPVDKVLFIAHDEVIPTIMAALCARLDGRATVVRSHRYFCEVIPLGVSKGQAVAWLAQYLGIPRERVLAVGDQENDIEMIRWAGTGVAMGNAPEVVKVVADWVAPSAEEDGAAVALEWWLHRG